MKKLATGILILGSFTCMAQDVLILNNVEAEIIKSGAKKAIIAHKILEYPNGNVEIIYPEYADSKLVSDNGKVTYYRGDSNPLAALDSEHINPSWNFVGMNIEFDKKLVNSQIRPRQKEEVCEAFGYVFNTEKGISTQNIIKQVKGKKFYTSSASHLKYISRVNCLKQ